MGATPKYITDANDATLPGFYAPNGVSCANIPSEWQFLYGTIIVSTGASFIEQLFLAWDVMAKRTRNYGNGVWTWEEWEYINPPMKVGIEYRTTERYNDKPVYTQLVNMGSLPNNDSKHVALVNCFTETRPNFSVVRYEYRLNEGTYRSVNPTHLDQLRTTNIFWSVVQPNDRQWYAFVNTDYDASNSTAMGQIWYTID